MHIYDPTAGVIYVHMARDMDAYAAWSVSDREQVPPSLVVSARLQLGAGPRSDPTRSQKPTRNPLDGSLRPGGGHPRHFPIPVRGVLGLARLHTDEEA